MEKLLDAFSSKDPNNKEFDAAIDSIWKEVPPQDRYFWSLDLNVSDTWKSIVKKWPDKKRAGFMVYLTREINAYEQKNDSWVREDIKAQKNTVRKHALPNIFRLKMILDEEDAHAIFSAFTEPGGRHRFFTQWPVAPFINLLEKQWKSLEISPSLKALLLDIKEQIGIVDNIYEEKQRFKMMEKIDALIFSSENKDILKPAKFLGQDPFGYMANDMIEKMPVEEKHFWYRLLPIVQKVNGSKPTTKFLDETKKLLSIAGSDTFKKTLHEWFRFLVNLKERVDEKEYDYGNGQVYNYATTEYISSVNAEAVKGLVWVCAHFHDHATIQLLSALAERSFRKIPGTGPTAAIIGNACLYSLYKSKGLEGIGQLSRLKLRIKQSNTQGLIDKYLETAAAEKGVSVYEIEDMAVNDCGLENGTRKFVFDEYTASLVVTGIGKTETQWFKPDGTLQKSVPAFVKEKHGPKLKKLKDTAKEVEQTLVSQRDRIDRMLRSNRKIPKEKFDSFYLQHGLMGYIAKKIIWNFHLADKTVAAINLNEHWVDVTNEIVPVENAMEVSLWHPVLSTLADIKSWRDFLQFHQVLQPLKQAYREVYLLTDAEINTRTYSNRMAAHLIRQHQFNSLAKTRGWKYALLGAFDNGMNNGFASLLLPEFGLRAEYWINEIHDQNQINDTGIYNYVSTDQVRFVDAVNESVKELVDIPSLVFSEVMRDVDLFVGVASVGNDPLWRDNGEMPAYADYWQSFSFGELTELARSRKEILTGLLPRLKISKVAEIKDKFLVVKGKLRSYKIHIGSTNILMEPNDQYLCIVPARGEKNLTENLFLPFEGDNGLSIILSKAFLLADDDKITDSTITSQINRK